VSAGAILSDIRFATKSLLRSRGFTFIAVVTLGLGIGGNASMFSLLNAYMLRPAPYADRARLDRIYRATGQNSRGSVSPADYLDARSDLKGYGEIAAYGGLDISLSEPGRAPEMAVSLRASTNLFSILGTKPELGRDFRPDEETLGNHRVLIINRRYWQNHFGADPHIIGRTVRVDGEPHEIVGVLTAGFSDFRHLDGVDVFRPLALDDKEARDRSSAWLRLVGRRSPDLAAARADSLIADFGRRLAADFPAANADTTWRAVPIDDTLVPTPARGILVMLVGLSGFVLLIACSNLANLMLARTMTRAREMALRAALGASRARLLRPLIVESLILAIAGGLCAVFVAMWTFHWLEAASNGDNTVGVVLTFDWRVFAWALGACLFTALAFGVAPAHFALRLDLNHTLKSGGRGSSGDRGHRRFREFLIVGQFALAMVLLAGAALFVRGVHELNGRRVGWESEQLVTGTMALPVASYPGDKQVGDFQRLALERLEALPGVASASLSDSLPFVALTDSRRFVVSGREAPQPGREPVALVNGVSPHYFATVGTRLLSGRPFGAGDGLTSPRVFIVNQAMARGLFGDESPIGRRIAQAGRDAAEWGEIVGVVADVQSVNANPSTVTYQLYVPMAQEVRRSSEIAVRSAGPSPSALVNSIRATMMSLDSDLPVRQLQSADRNIAQANYGYGVVGSLLAGMALLGLGLASLGVYGVIARTVAQRTGEFGIRVTLGASAKDIVRLVLSSGVKLSLLGSALGLLGAFGTTRLMAAAFPGIRTDNAAVVIGVTFLLIGIGQIAGYVPARRASRVDPTEALRAE
jgi:putative ABC transport system permease protein